MRIVRQTFRGVVFAAPLLATCVATYFALGKDWSYVMLALALPIACLATANPPDPVLSNVVAFRLGLGIMLPIGVWNIVFYLVGINVDAALLLAKLTALTYVPLLLLSRWSIRDVIVLGEIGRLREYAHLLPSAIQTALHSGPTWISEAREIAMAYGDGRNPTEIRSTRFLHSVNIVKFIVLFLVACVLYYVTKGRNLHISSVPLPEALAPIPFRLLWIVGISCLGLLIIPYAS